MEHIPDVDDPELAAAAAGATATTALIAAHVKRSDDNAPASDEPVSADAGKKRRNTELAVKIQRGILKIAAYAGPVALRVIDAAILLQIARTCLAIPSLLPVLDLVSDLLMYAELSHSGYEISPKILLGILYLSWRFATAYAALTPRPSLRKIAALYVPFLLLPSWGDLMAADDEDEVDKKKAATEAKAEEEEAKADEDAVQAVEADVEAAGPSAGVSAAGAGGSAKEAETAKEVALKKALKGAKEEIAALKKEVRAIKLNAAQSVSDALYGTEPRLLRQWLANEHKRYAECEGVLAKALIAAGLEAKLVVSLLVGPYFVWRAALTLGRETAFPEVLDDEHLDAAERNKLYQRVLTVIEAVLESLPQLVLQGALYYMHPERINPYVFAFSVGCSLAGLAFAGYNFFKHREAILKILGPPKELIAWEAEEEDGGFEPMDPEVWRRGGRKAAEAKVECAGNFGGPRLAMTPDGSLLVGAGSAASTEEASIYSSADASVVLVLSGPSSAVYCIATDGEYIFGGCNDGSIYVWTVKGEPVGELPNEHSIMLFSLAVLGDTLVSGSQDSTAKVWSFSARTCTATLSEHTGPVYGVAVTAEAIATGSGDKTLRIWPVGGGASRHTKLHPADVWTVAMAGDLLATGCSDKVIRTFSVATGQLTRELRGCTGAVMSLALSGSMLVSGDAREKVKVWALTGEASAECVATLEGHSDMVRGVVAGPDFVASQAYGSAELLVWRPA